MSRKRVHRQVARSPEQIAQEQAVRSRFQAERPSLEALVESGEYHAPISQDEYLALMQFVSELKKHRESQNLSLSDVAERSGIDKAALSRIESGRAGNPTLVTLERIARAIGKRLRLTLEDCAQAS